MNNKSELKPCPFCGKDMMYVHFVTFKYLNPLRKGIDKFEKPCSHDCKNCKYWYSGTPIDYEPPYCEWEDCVITRPPQSWCYVEEVER